MSQPDLKSIKALFLDMDGVLWSDKTEIGCLKEIFADIEKAGLKVCFGTNNATKTPEEYCAKLAGFGVHAEPEQFFSSAIATIDALHKAYPQGASIYVVGTDSLKKMLSDAGFEIRDEDAEKTDVVVAGADWNVTYQKIAAAMRLILGGAVFYATNGDLTFPTPNGWRPGAGMIVTAISCCSGAEPIMIGKPNPKMLYMTCEATGLKPEEFLAVGDRHETDILSGANAGAHTALVLTGFETEETLPKLDPQPEIVCKDLTELIGLFNK